MRLLPAGDREGPSVCFQRLLERVAGNAARQPPRIRIDGYGSIKPRNPRRLHKTPSKAKGLPHLAGRIILAFMALLSPVQEGEVWRVKMVWPNGAVHYFGNFPSERGAIYWITAHPRLTRPEDTMDEP